MGLNNLTHGGVRPLWDLLIFNPWWGPSSLGLTDSSRLVVKFAQQSPECSFIKPDLIEENTCPYLG